MHKPKKSLKSKKVPKYFFFCAVKQLGMAKCNAKTVRTLCVSFFVTFAQEYFVKKLFFVWKLRAHMFSLLMFQKVSREVNLICHIWWDWKLLPIQWNSISWKLQDRIIFKKGFDFLTLEMVPFYIKLMGRP